MRSANAVRASTTVAVDPATAFRLFTDEVDSWWKHGPRFRWDTDREGTMRFEPRVGGRFLEVYDEAAGDVFEAVDAGTRVVVEHRGWERLRPDHPVRHDLEGTAFTSMMGLWWADLLTAARDAAATRRP